VLFFFFEAQARSAAAFWMLTTGLLVLLCYKQNILV
jgi:hypothetical protein